MPPTTETRTRAWTSPRAGRRSSEASGRRRGQVPPRPAPPSGDREAQRCGAALSVKETCGSVRRRRKGAGSRRHHRPRGEKNLDAIADRRKAGARRSRARPHGRGVYAQGQYKEVEPLLAEYVKERPRSSWGWYALGYSLFAQQRIGESIKALARSLELDVTNAEAHKILGRNLMIIGRFDAAQIEFEQAIRYKPDSAESHYNLGKLFSIQDTWEPARQAFEAALRIDPSYVEAIDALGFALEALVTIPGRSRATRRPPR